jgi:hypothetical protein
MNFTFTSHPPVLNKSNNRILIAPKAMPFKNSNSSGDSTFSSGRAVYSRSLDLSLTKISSPSNEQSIIWKKKFCGGTNRDASSVAQRNKANTIGFSTINESGGEISFS